VRAIAIPPAITLAVEDVHRRRRSQRRISFFTSSELVRSTASRHDLRRFRHAETNASARGEAVAVDSNAPDGWLDEPRLKAETLERRRALRSAARSGRSTRWRGVMPTDVPNRSSVDSLAPGSSGFSAVADYFFFNLVRSSLVPPDEVREAAADATQSEGDSGVRRWQQRWIDAGRMTEWQIEALTKGRRTFIYNRYKVLDYLGRGGMGSVFKGIDLKSGKFVALKFINDEFASKPNALARFSREVELMLKLDHPNIVRAYFADLDGLEPYVAMEYVAGETIRSYIDAGGPLPVPFSCECIRQAALGMHYAHQHGVVHRDVKPTNVMIAWNAPNGGPLIKVLDLGLTRLHDQTGDRDVGLTATGQCIGTPEYIAPEQAFNSKVADGRSDVFSLACTLFHMLTNQLPYSGRSALEQVLARADRTALSASEFRPDLPPALVGLIAKALERDPKKRLTAIELADALAPFSPGPERLGYMRHEIVVHTAPSADPAPTIYREPTPHPGSVLTRVEPPRPDPGDKIVARLKSLVKANDDPR
jgi:serine/threonine protein kinase